MLEPGTRVRWRNERGVRLEVIRVVPEHARSDGRVVPEYAELWELERLDKIYVKSRRRAIATDELEAV